MQVMIFGSVSSPCLAQYVNAEIYKDTHPKANKAIVDNHYVDDYVDSFDDMNEAISVIRDVVYIHNQAGFELRGFVSNSKKLLTAINDSEYINDDQSLTNLCDNETTSGKILGRQSDDSFCFVLKFARVPKEVLNGDRKVLSLTILSTGVVEEQNCVGFAHS
ncbi:uncharacterized protein LOC119599794 [Lucilia sericata]|uniref:uncharacterized protein LOC119599794 n=1 Tax=Lucilia sericata TaxID=13632 RepID=UPI0018A866A5|nr:uncharacterized protein LOC119599794 [Lucilia sericata]